MKKTTKILEYLFGEGKEIPKEDLLDHEFFTKERWDFIEHYSSYYHHPENVILLFMIDIQREEKSV